VDIKRLQVMFKEQFNMHSSKGTKIPERALLAVMVKLYQQTDWGQIMAHYLTKQVGTIL
jgi:hypothetical protein